MFFKLSNLASFATEPVERPWEPSASPPDEVQSKDAYLAWLSDPATKTSLVSAFEGMSPVVRIGKENPPVKLHGLIVDYDNRSTTTDKLRELAEKPACEWVPSWGTLSFRKGAKLFWLFERPVPVQPGMQCTRFLERLFKELKLNNWLGGCDIGATANPAQYYAVGKESVEIGGRPIPHEMLVHWAWESVRDTVLWSDFKRYEIPIEEVEKEMNERFPGRWRGQFSIGARGVRFWDPSADNPTGAQIRADGVTCYTGDRAFMSWLDIFGKHFVARFAASKTAELLEGTYYDGAKFYAKVADDEGGHFVEWDKADFSQYLRTKGFDPSKTKGKTCSELDEAEVAIKTQRRVDMARKLVHFPRGVIRWRGKTFLNMGAPEPVRPAPSGPAPLSWDDGEKHFPLVRSFMDTFFTDENGEDEFNQRLHIFAWLKRFYESGLDNAPTQGPVVIISGPTGKGKSLFSEGIVGGLMGGCEDGADYLVENGRWTANIVESPVIYVGDTKATEDWRSVATLSNNLKKIVANATMRAAQKYSKEGDVPWFGRILISCNEDAESLTILPNMEISNREKVCLFRASKTQFPFPDRRVLEKQLRQELPFFGRFLVDWKVPEELVPRDSRFGFKHFHHPFLLDAATQQGASGLLAEYLMRFIRLDSAAVAGSRDCWIGTSAELFRCLVEMDPQVEREFRTVRTFNACLGQLRSRGVPYLDRVAPASKGNPSSWAVRHSAVVGGGAS